MIMKRSNELKTGLADHLARLWRYGLVLSGNRKIAEDLVHRTCIRANQTSHEFALAAKLDKSLFSMLHSIWWNELRSQHADGQSALNDAKARERDSPPHPILRRLLMLEDMQREAFFLVYVETLSYREAAAILEVPIETVMAQLANARERLAKLAAGSADPTPTQVKSG